MYHASDDLLIDRKRICKLLHMSLHSSYRYLMASRVDGKVMVEEVRSLLRRSSKHGCEDDFQSLVDVAGVASILGVSNRMAHRIIERSPHYCISNKIKLISTTELYKALKKEH